ncbi:hypothetical protein B296_00044828 [Ensete ventricosum]|uniref:Uncharacterized protein n=1 Tax=Ensete ventricosum TaxID=4639 RepID=A0A426XEG4_ENSVE|nr:hypothetical protein B296_00044828 [Ensete ventricosum]
MGSRRKFARRFVEGIGKLAGNAKGDCQEEDRRTCRKIVGGCRMVGPPVPQNSSDSQYVSVGKPLIWMEKKKEVKRPPL